MLATTRLALSIPELCAEIGISRAHFYNLTKAGGGPRVTKVGSRSVVLVDDARAWLKSLASDRAPQLVSPPPPPSAELVAA